jgi:hypothetical protein
MISKIRKAPVALVSLVALLIFLLACAGDETTTDTSVATSGALPVAGEGGVPASVTKLTVAVDGWGAAEDLNPVHNLQVNFLRDYVNLFLLMRDEDHNIVPGLSPSGALPTRDSRGLSTRMLNGMMAATLPLMISSGTSRPCGATSHPKLRVTTGSQSSKVRSATQK